MTLRIGWIGCGNHAAEMLLPQLVREDVRLVAICDVAPTRLALVGQRYGVPDSDRTQDWRAVLARDDVDALGLAIGAAQHAEIGCAAIARRLPLFMEKPPASSAAEARALAAAARGAEVPVVTGFMKRFSTANRIAANVLSSATFGARASFLGHYMTAPTYFARDADYTGFFLHHCVHYMDLVPWLMGDISKLTARAHVLAPGRLLIHVDMRFAGGGLGTLVMGTHQSRGTPMEWWQVMGDHARVEVRNVHEVRHFRHPPFKADAPDAMLDPTCDTLVWEPNLTAAANEDHKGYRAILAAFAAVARGERRDVPTLDDGARAMHHLETMIADVQRDLMGK